MLAAEKVPHTHFSINSILKRRPSVRTFAADLPEAAARATPTHYQRGTLCRRRLSDERVLSERERERIECV